MQPDRNDFQSRLFGELRSALPHSASMVDELCDLLKLSTNSVYRRINGEIRLTIDELELISNFFRLSLDSLCRGDTNSVTFDFSPMANEKNFGNYILSIIHDLETIRKHEKGMVFYAAEDIPLFYNFFNPVLAAFKIFYWERSVMNVPELQNLKFNPLRVGEEILSIGKKLYLAYAAVPSIELWTEMTPMSLFKQIEFYWESGLFESREDALALCDAVMELFALLKKSASAGCKFDLEQKKAGGEDSYQLYLSDVEIGHNCILTDMAGNKTVYLAFNTFNKLSTRHWSYCNDTELWLKNLKGKSNPISGVSEKKRSQFFIHLEDGVENTRKKILG
jgi:hypothetical protein